MDPSAVNGAHFKRGRINLLAPDDPTAIRTVPELVDFNASHNPTHPLGVQLLPENGEMPGPSITITHLQFRNAVSCCARRLREEIIGLSSPRISDVGEVTKSRPVALFLESNIGLLIHLLALMGMGVPVRISHEVPILTAC